MQVPSSADEVASAPSSSKPCRPRRKPSDETTDHTPSRTRQGQRGWSGNSADAGVWRDRVRSSGHRSGCSGPRADSIDQMMAGRNAARGGPGSAIKLGLQRTTALRHNARRDRR